ncbi:peptidyl-tRNA hydrolase [Clostridia bacterium]|nr:peptidyl-tRNA hydrolase [Clostridia bacterium]
MIVLAGLGNPGAKYANTKHNVGFLTIDRLAEQHGIAVTKSRHHALVGDGLIGGKKVLLVKPQTFMNDSGRSVRAVLDYYNIEHSDLAVVYDDIDLPTGRIRIRSRGSAGTHNGMRSILEYLQTDDFPRFRIGIGAERGYVPLVDYVLTGFAPEQRDLMRVAIDRCADALGVFVSDGITAAMQQYNEKKKPKKADEEAAAEKVTEEAAETTEVTETTEAK